MRMLLGVVAVVAAGCGTTLPRRLVLEESMGPYAYRRYQRVLDVEFVIPGNDAVGHTATYMRRASDTQVHVATAFVTRYANARGLTAEIAERVRDLESYDVTIVEVEGAYAWKLDGHDGDRWVLWVSGRHVVKLGAAERVAFPEELVERYVELYASDLDARGRALPDAPSRGPAASAEREREEDDEGPDLREGTVEERELPRHLQENAPR